MKLLVENPDMPPRYFPWNIYTQGEFELCKEDVELLEEGDTLWLGETALTLEQEEPCGNAGSTKES